MKILILKILKEKIRIRRLVGFTDKEFSDLKNEYLNSNFNSFSRFCNSKLTNSYFLVNEKSFANLFIELSKIGNNLNQISKTLNSVQYDFSEIDFDIIIELKTLIQEIKNYQNFLLDKKI